MKALVIGGAGATGIHIVAQLLERDYQVSIMHRGKHVPDFPQSVERIVADPFTREGLKQGLEGRDFDLVVATYGKLKYVAEALVGRTDRLISVGGAAPVYKGFGEMTSMNPWETTQATPLFLQEDHPLASAEGIDPFAEVVRKTEGWVMDHHRNGDYNVSHFRYPLVYGPCNICPAEWAIVRRVMDQRKTLIMPGGGLTMVARGYSENIAHAIALAVDKPEASAGQIYNICDEEILYNHEWVARLSDILGHKFDTVHLPFELLPEGFRATATQLLYRHHAVLDVGKAKRQLGYRDVVAVDEALERTVRWYMDNPIPPGGEAELNLGDPFDYAYEDQLVALYRRQLESMREDIAEMAHKEVVWHHPYM